MLEGKDIRPEAVFEEVVALLAEPARAEAERDIDLFQWWLEMRLRHLGVFEGNRRGWETSCKLRDYPRTAGLGIQSVEIHAMQGGRDVVLSDEVAGKHPTLGLIVEGLLDGVQGQVEWVRMGFPIAPGSAEHVMGLSRTPEGGDEFVLSAQAPVWVLDKDPRRLVARDTAIISERHVAHTVLQKVNPRPEEIWTGRKNQGAYACRNVRRSA